MNTKALLVGMLLTDGYVRNTSKGYRIVFANKSDILCNIFRKNIEKIYGKQYFQIRKDKYDVNIITINNKNIVKDLLKTYNSYRTKPNDVVNIPNLFWELNKYDLSETFRIIFSCDGSVSLGVKWHKRFNSWVLTRKVALACKNNGLLEDYQKILKEKFDLKFKINKNELVIKNKENILHFRKLIGFINGVKVSKKSKNWEGYEKNEILNLLIETFKVTQNFYRKFETKEEILSFLTNLLHRCR